MDVINFLLSLKGLYIIAPGSARGSGFPKEKSAARTAGFKNHRGFAAQYSWVNISGEKIILLFCAQYLKGNEITELQI